MKKSSETEILWNASFHLKYHNSNKLLYFKLKIQPNTLKMWHFGEKISTVEYGPKQVLFLRIEMKNFNKF